MEQKSNSSLITLESNVMAVMDRKHQAMAGRLAEQRGSEASRRQQRPFSRNERVDPRPGELPTTREIDEKSHP